MHIFPQKAHIVSYLSWFGIRTDLVVVDNLVVLRTRGDFFFLEEYAKVDAGVCGEDLVLR